MNQFPPAPEYPIRTVSNFVENSRRYSHVKLHHRSTTPVANFSANFRQNLKRPYWYTPGLALQDCSNIRIFQGLCGNIPSCHAGMFKYRNISGPMWKYSFLTCGNMQISAYFRARVGAFLPTCGNIQISEYFKARMGTFLPKMREYSNIGIFQGPCGKILSCRTVHVFTLSGI
jgi:hypothetical protein